ncbi:MAG: hypothetical protein GY868_16875 [Deltaproteobacteria bacterium]|nr:hypothetical protein [Deltaproteobacteria bacterium]
MRRFLTVIVILATAVVFAAFDVSSVLHKSKNITRYIGGADSAELTIAVPFETTTVAALKSFSPQLVEAELEYTGIMVSWETGRNRKELLLKEYLSPYMLPGADGLDWSVRISPDLPLALVAEVGSGLFRADLRKIQLESLAVSVDSGSAKIRLPVSDEPLPLDVDISDGVMEVDLPEGSRLLADVMIGSGALAVNIDDVAPVRLFVRERQPGSSVHLPDTFEPVNDEYEVAGTVWETAAAASIESPTIISVSIKSGSFALR